MGLRYKKITLYHGTVSIFTSIDLNKCRPFSDFGKGFYTAVTRKQGVNMAEHRQIETYKRTNCKEPQRLYKYEIIENYQNIAVMKFDTADIDWVEFVLNNRRSKTFNHNFDLVIGPTADDRTNDVLDLYLDGVYGDVGSTGALDFLLKQLEPQNLGIQYCFLTEKSTKLLTLMEVILL